jgi:hypothetical protein
MIKKNKCLKMTTIFICFSLSVNSLKLQSIASEDSQSAGKILEELHVEREKEIDMDIEYENLESQIVLNEVYNVIEDNLTNTVETSDEQTVYDDDYSGSFLDENGDLIVCVTESFKADSESDETILNEIEAEDEIESIETFNQVDGLEDIDADIELKTVKYSYNELSDAQIKMVTKFEDFKKIYTNSKSAEFELLQSIAGIGLDEEINGLVVDIVEFTAEKEELFHSLFGKFDYISFNDVASEIEQITAYKPGRAIYVITKKTKTSIYYSRISIGYRAFRDTTKGRQYGFVTCAHAVNNSIDGKIYSTSKLSKIIGSRRIWQYGGSVDASFIELSPGQSMSTKVKYSNKDGSTANPDTIAKNIYLTSVAKNSTVYKVGSTTYRTSGKVTNTNYSVTNDDDVSFTNQTKTSALAKGGDSGGIFYSKYESKNVPAGIAMGAGGFWIFNYSVYSKASAIENRLGAVPY